MNTELLQIVYYLNACYFTIQSLVSLCQPDLSFRIFNIKKHPIHINS